MYNYHDTAIRKERVRLGTDHCDSDGPVFELDALLRDGLLWDPRHPEVLLESERSTIIFAIGDAHRFRIGFDGMRGHPSAVKHETLFHNANVLAAGELHVKSGVIVDLNDHSGSYRTYGKLDADPGFARALLEAAGLLGVPMSDRLRRKLRRRKGRE